MNGITVQVQHGGKVTQDATTLGELDIIEGSPVSHYHDFFQAANGTLTVNLWDCSAGRMRFHYSTDEIVHILEGEVTIVDEHGRAFELRAGDVAHFARGSTLDWTITTYVKKLAIHRHESPARVLFERVRRAPRKLAGRFA